MADYPPAPNRARMRWRQGAGRGMTTTVFAQEGERPDCDDPIVCVCDTPELTVHVVAAHNSMLRFNGPDT